MSASLLADLLLLAHALFAAFVVFTLPLVAIGGWRGWGWVRNPWLRGLHLAAIAVVAIQAWAGVACPLTVWEDQLRLGAGGAPYGPRGFVATWVHELLFYTAEPWVFTAAYTLFGAAVIAAWLAWPPRLSRGRGARR